MMSIEENINIMILDDDAITRKLISEVVKEAGVKRITECETIAQAEVELSRQTIHIAFIDIGLPDGSGLDILQVIRKNFTQVTLPVIVISGHNDDEKIAHSIELGANDYITKPMSQKVIKARMMNTLVLRRLKMDFDAVNERFLLAAQGASDALWDWVIESDELTLSSRWRQILGSESSEEYNFKNFVNRIHPEDITPFRHELNEHLSGITEVFEFECRMQASNGAYRWLLIRGNAVRRSSGKPYRMAGSISDITKRKIQDPLTKALNYGAFLDQLDLLIKNYVGNEQPCFAVTVFTIDRYQVINDCYGHHYCDHLISKVSNEVMASLSPKDTLARIANDKLAFIVEQPKDKAEFLKWLSTEVLKPFVFPLFSEQKSLHISYSAAVVYDTKLYSNSHEIMRDAEIALMRAMHKPQDKVIVFKPNLQVSLRERIEFEEEIHQALENDEFVLYFQPKVSEKGEVLGAEALVRWINQHGECVPPAKFIPVAEETGLIIELGKVLFKQLCNFIHESQQLGEVLPISFNLSGKQFLDPHLCETMVSTMNERGINGSNIELEITESTILHDVDDAVQIIEQLKAAGLSVSIDDFGTGYSSLAYLKALPIETIKIDKSFVYDLPNDQNNAAITKAIVSMSKALNLKVVAEGVETDTQLAFLENLNVELYQGYFFYKPMPADDYLKLLKTVNEQ